MAKPTQETSVTDSHEGLGRTSNRGVQSADKHSSGESRLSSDMKYKNNVENETLTCINSGFNKHGYYALLYR